MKSLLKYILILLFINNLYGEAINSTQKEISSLIDSCQKIPVLKSNISEINNISNRLLNLGIKNNNKNAIAYSYYTKGLSYFLLEKYNNSLESYYTSLKVIDTNEQIVGTIYTYISMCHQELNNLERASVFIDKAIEFTTKVNENEKLTTLYTSKGILNMQLSKFDEAEKLFNLSLDNNQKFKDSSGIIIDYVNLSYAYFYQEDYDKTIAILKNAEFLSKKINTSLYLSTIYNHLSSSFKKLDEIDSSILYIEKSIKNIQPDENLSNQAAIYYNAFEIYRDFNNLPQSDKYYNIHLKLKDSLSQLTNIEEYINLESNFRNEEKSTPKKPSNNYMLYVIIALVLLFLGLLIYFKKKKTTHKKEIINQDFDLFLSSILTKRESEITVLLLKGKTNSEIAEELFLSKHTVVTHRKNIYKKLEITSTPELLIWASKNGYKI